MKLEEKQISSKSVFEGKVVSLYVDDIELPNGNPATREVIKHPGGVCVIAITDDKEILLVKQFRYGIGKITTEIPAGKLNYGENPLECGKRELLEETGIVAKDYTFLGEFYPTPAYCGEIIYIYMAQNLEYKDQKLDPDEFLNVEKIPLDEAVKLVLDNEIADGKTIAAILKARLLLG